MADDAEGEVVADHVGSGDEDERGGQDHQDRVDDEPAAVLLEVALQAGAHDLQRPAVGHVRGVMERHLGLMAQVPQQALLGDAVGQPGERTRLHTTDDALRLIEFLGRLRSSTVARLLGGREHRRELMLQPGDQTAFRRLRVRLGFFDGGLAVQFVAIPPERDQEHVHSWILR